MTVWLRVFNPLWNIAVWIDGYVWRELDQSPLAIANDNGRWP